MLKHQKKKERNQHSSRTQWTKNEERVRNPWDTLKSSNIQIPGMAEGEEEEQEMEKVFEQIMKEHFPNLAKEMDLQGVREAQRVPKK